MVGTETVRAFALALPEAQDRSKPPGLAFYVRGKLFAWSWLERVEPKKPRRPNPRVLVVYCPMEAKETLLESFPDTLFTEPHYAGYPVVLVRLDVVDEAELRGLIEAAWACQAPPTLLGKRGR
jgi:hypothetical protein